MHLRLLTAQYMIVSQAVCRFVGILCALVVLFVWGALATFDDFGCSQC